MLWRRNRSKAQTALPTAVPLANTAQRACCHPDPNYRTTSKSIQHSYSRLASQRGEHLDTMAYNGGYEGQGRPYAGLATARPAPQQRQQYPPGPPGQGGQQFNGPPPQQYDQYQDDYGYGYDDGYGGNGYGPGYGEQYDDMNYGRGPPPNQKYPPQQDYYGPPPGRGGAPRGRGRGGAPMGRPPPLGGQYPPGSGGPGPGRGGYPPARGGRPPTERHGNSDPTGE